MPIGVSNNSMDLVPPVWAPTPLPVGGGVTGSGIPTFLRWHPGTSRMLVGGTFDDTSPSTNSGAIAAHDPVTDTWSSPFGAGYKLQTGQWIYDIRVHPTLNRVYIGGDFTQYTYLGTPYTLNRGGYFIPGSYFGTDYGNTTGFSGTVWSIDFCDVTAGITQAGDRLYCGGFTNAYGIPYYGFAQFRDNTYLNSLGYNTLVFSPRDSPGGTDILNIGNNEFLLYGGWFWFYDENGTQQQSWRIIKVSLSTNTVTRTFGAVFNGFGQCMIKGGSNVFIGGGFTAPGSYLVKMNATATDAPSAVGGGYPNNIVEAMVWDSANSRLYIVGRFSAVAGVPAVGIAVWDQTLNEWRKVVDTSAFPYYPNSVALAGNGDLYVGGQHTAPIAKLFRIAAADLAQIWA